MVLKKFSAVELKRIERATVLAAEKAGKFIRTRFRTTLMVREKARSSLVTEVDVKSEKIIFAALKKISPDFAFFGEETSDGQTASTTIPTWHVDPLDGTTNFVHGLPFFAVSIGLAIGNKPLVGVVHIPMLRETFHASLGNGAFLNGKPMRVSSRNKFSECLLTTGFAYTHDKGLLIPEIERFKKVHLQARAVRRPGAAAIDLAYVAAGIFDGFWEKNLSSWDVCAGALLITEAGGKVTDYEGEKFAVSGKQVLASNGKIHKRMMELLK